MPDHIHLLVRFPAPITIANFIKEVKGSTSHLMTHMVNPDEFYKWQGSHAVFFVSEKELLRIESYIQRQKEHHATHNIKHALES